MTLFKSKFKKKQECSVDWLRIVIGFDNPGGSEAAKIYSGDWTEERNVVLKAILDRFDFGVGVDSEMGTRQGYTHVISFNEVEIQYHHKYSYIGIMLDFSGNKLRDLRSRGLSDLELCKLFNDFTVETKSKIWVARFRRVDIAIDYFNYDYNVDQIARKVTLKNNSIDVYYDKYNKNKNTYTDEKSKAEAYAMMNNSLLTTLYVGRSTGKFQVRLYDKLIESKSKNSCVIPLEVDSWIRVELVAKDTTSLAFQHSVNRIKNDEEFKALMFKFILRKFKLKYINSNRYHKITQDMIEKSKDAKIVEYSELENENELKSKLNYMVSNSGLISLVQILKHLEDRFSNDEIVSLFFEIVSNISDERTKSKDTLTTINKIDEQVLNLDDLKFMIKSLS